MAETAIKPMTLDEFLRWDDGTETHHELVGGFPVAMAPPAEAHRILAMRLGSRIDVALSSRRPCNAQIEAGVILADRADTYFEADIAATCEGNEPGRQAIKDPSRFCVRGTKALRSARPRIDARSPSTIPKLSRGVLDIGMKV